MSYGYITFVFLTGAFVIGITALDPDEGANGQVLYYLNTSNNYFSINETTGVITTRQTLTSDIASEFSLLVTAADMVLTPLFMMRNSVYKLVKKNDHSVQNNI